MFSKTQNLFLSNFNNYTLLLYFYSNVKFLDVHPCSEKSLYHCFLAELASLLIRNVTYEGPALRRQLAKAQQLQQELSRREVECQSSAADMRERYYAACKQYGIRVSTGTSARDGQNNSP